MAPGLAYLAEENNCGRDMGEARIVHNYFSSGQLNKSPLPEPRFRAPCGITSLGWEGITISSREYSSGWTISSDLDSSVVPRGYPSLTVQKVGEK